MGEGKDIDVMEFIGDEIVKEAKTRGKVHYLRFDDSVVKFKDGQELTFLEGWNYVCTVFKSTNPREITERLIAFCRRLILAKQQPTPKEKPKEQKTEKEG